MSIFRSFSFIGVALLVLTECVAITLLNWKRQHLSQSLLVFSVIGLVSSVTNEVGKYSCNEATQNKFQFRKG